MPPAPDHIVLEPFLNLGPKRWWQLIDEEGRLSKWECDTAGAGRFHLRVTLGKVVIEHDLEATPIVQDGTALTRYTIVASTIDDRLATWVGGLVFPAVWKVGDRVEATSKEPANPATGNPVRLRVTLARSGPWTPPAGTPFPPDRPLHVIELRQAVSDTGMGSALAESNQVFAIGLGICAAQGQNFGVFYKTKFLSWSGGQ